MASTTFIDYVAATNTPGTLIQASWLNDVNAETYIIKKEQMATAGGTVDAITASYTVSLSDATLYDGMRLVVKTSGVNTSTTPTFAPTINTVVQTPRTIVKYVAGSEVALVAGDIQGYIFLIYDLTNTKWILMNPGVSVNIAPIIHAATNKATPVDADELGIWDSVTGLLNKVTWANLKTTLSSFFTTISSLAASSGSSLVGFQQAGTGTVSRILQDKNRETVSAKDFGAVGDGVADDTTAIQAAFNYASSVKKRVFFPAGTYKGNWVLASDTGVIGDSRNGTVFIPAVNSPVFSVSTSVSTARLHFESFSITGNLGFASQHGISLKTTVGGTIVNSVYIWDVYIATCGASGIYTYGVSSGGPLVQELIIEYSVIAGCVAQGLFMDGAAFEVVFTSLWVYGCGTKSVPNVQLGNSSAGVYRLTWVGGGFNQSSLNTTFPPRHITDLVTTATSTTATSASAPFTSADTGKTIAIHNGDTFGQPLITTMTYVNTTTVTLGAVANTTNAGGTHAIIDCSTGTGGLVQIANGKQVKFIGCDMEAASQFFTISGTLNQNISIDSCNLGGAQAALSTVWIQGNGDGLELINCNTAETSVLFYNGLFAGTNGATPGVAAQYKNAFIQPPSNPALLANCVMFDYQNVASTMTLYNRCMPYIRINGSGTVNKILDAYGGTTAFYRGQRVVLMANTTSATINYYTTASGNIYTNTGAAVVLAAGKIMNLVWDDVLIAGGVWVQV